MLHIGIVRKFFRNTGIGYIAIDTKIKLGEDIMFHAADIQSIGYEHGEEPFIIPNSRVSYEIGTDEDGKTVAKNIRVIR